MAGIKRLENAENRPVLERRPQPAASASAAPGETPVEQGIEASPDGEIVVPVIEEELLSGVREVETGKIWIDKQVETRVRRIDTPLLREEVEMRRVPVNKEIKVPPAIRKEGHELVIPVVEEQLVVTKRLILKEEIRITKRKTKEHFVKDVKLKRERAEVRRAK
jgi:uncharacterized protein (TIGR02271 family)